MTAGPTNGWSGPTAEGSATGGVPTLSLAATSKGRLILNDETIKHLKTKTVRPELMLRRGDVLVQRSNTRQLVGTTAVFDGAAKAITYPDLMMRLRFRDPADGRWFWRYANSEHGRHYFERVAAGSTGSMPKLSGQHLRDMQIPLPPKEERDAILDALAVADGLIESLEQLLAKKRQIKQGVMQELLTGKRRLPGFDRPWERKLLHEVAVIDPGSLGADTPSDFRFNYISLEDVDKGKLRSSSETIFRVAPSRARRVLRMNDVLVATVRPSLQSHLLVDWDPASKWVASTGFSVVRCNPDVDPKFIYFHFFGPVIPPQIEGLLTGSNYPAINGSELGTLFVDLPDPAEQVAICSVLMSLDQEIGALEQALGKYELLKQAIAQALLTGRIRLLDGTKAENLELVHTG